MFQMKISKEATVGIVVVLAVLGVISATTGIYGILYLGIAYVLTVISIKLFFHKSVPSKVGAVILNTDIAYKILMPSKYKKALKELESKQQSE